MSAASKSRARTNVGPILLLMLSLSRSLNVLADPPPGESQSEKKPAPAAPALREQPTLTDRYGDPLPAGTIARLGTVRFRYSRLTPEGKLLAVLQQPLLLAILDGLPQPTVSIWDLRKRKKIGTIEGADLFPSRLRNLAFSPNGKLLVFPHASGFRVWDVVTGKMLFQLDLGAKVRPGCAIFSSDSTLLATTTYPVPLNPDRTIHLWDMATGKELGALKGHESAIAALAASPKRNVLASASLDGTIWFWDLATRRETSRHQGDSRTHTLAFQLAEAARVPVDQAKIARLLAALDSAEFEVRAKASQGLQEQGILAEAAMKRALRAQPSLEVRRRLEQILEKLESGERPPEQLRILRAFEVLELIGTAEARQALRERAQDSADSWLKHEAKSALTRLAARP